MTEKNWKNWEGKKIYLRLRNGRIYSGNIRKVETADYPIIFIHIIDKFGLDVVIVSSEIVEIREEK